MTEPTEPMLPSRPWYRRKWVIITGSVLLGLLISIVILATVLFFMWQNSPERKLVEATRYAIEQPGSYKITGSDRDVNIQSSGDRQAISGTYEDVQLEAIIDGTTIYVKTATPELLMQRFGMDVKLPGQLGSAKDLVAPLIKDKWVKLGIDKIVGGTDGKTAGCLVSGSSQLKSNKDAPRQLAEVYARHRFLDIQKAAESGAVITYDIAAKEAVFSEFIAGLTQTPFYKSLSFQCDDAVEQAQVIGNTGRVTASIDTTKMRFTELRFTEKSTTAPDMTITADYAPVAEIQLPQDAVTFNELQATVTRTVLGSFFQGR